MSLPNTLLSDSSKQAAINLGPHKNAIIGVYYSLLILGGQLGIPLTIATMAFTKTANRRHPTLINFLLLSVVYTTANLILLYAGEASNPLPNHNLCLAQASLIHGSTIGVAAASLSLMLLLWMDIRNVSFAKRLLCRVMLVGFPWAFSLFITLGCAIYGARNAEAVTSKWVFYCSLQSDVIIYTLAAFMLFFLLMTIIIQCSVLFILLKASRKFRMLNRSSYHLTVRATIATIYLTAVFIISIVIVLKPTSIFAYLFNSTMPLIDFLIFGTQMDNLRAWTSVIRRAQNPRCTKSMRLKLSVPATTTTADQTLSMSESSITTMIIQEAC